MESGFLWKFKVDASSFFLNSFIFHCASPTGVVSGETGSMLASLTYLGVSASSTFVSCFHYRNFMKNSLKFLHFFHCSLHSLGGKKILPLTEPDTWCQVLSRVLVFCVWSLKCVFTSKRTQPPVSIYSTITKREQLKVNGNSSERHSRPWWAFEEKLLLRES